MSDDLYAHLTEPAAEVFAEIMPGPYASRRPAEGPMTFGGKVSWGDVWKRPHLSVRDRRIATMGVLAVLGRDGSVAAHAAGALRHGDLAPDDLVEIAVHLAVYAGLPLANAFNRTVQQEVASYREEQAQ
jgi:alkylhydroperoxidase/carboxymuconolactone decarboxylase family protein YurZ